MIGVVLGKAFDAALGIMVKNWRVVLIVWAAFAAAYVFDRTAYRWFASLMTEASTTVAAIIVCRALCVDFRWNSGLILRFWGAGIVYLLAIVGAPGLLTAIVLAVMIPLTKATGTSIFIGEALILLAITLNPYAFWTATRWSMAITLTLVENHPIPAAFARSWELTQDRFWVSTSFNVAVTLALIAISIAPMALIVAGFRAFHPSSSVDMTNGLLNAVLAPVTIYSQVASWIAYLLWLEWLKSPRSLQASNA